MADAGDAEIGVPMCQRIAVDKDFLFAALTGLAAEQRMLTAGDEARVVGEGSVGSGDARIVLLDAALHLDKELLLQRFGIRHACARVAVLGIEIGLDAGIERGRVAHHRLPVGSTKPGIVVAALNAVTERG